MEQNFKVENKLHPDIFKISSTTTISLQKKIKNFQAKQRYPQYF